MGGHLDNRTVVSAGYEFKLLQEPVHMCIGKIKPPQGHLSHVTVVTSEP